MERPLGAGHRRAVSSLCAIGTRMARTRLCLVVTEWVLAGQQTVICKHHEGKHQSTLDFFLFFIIFFFFVNTLETDPQCLSKVKKKMPFPSWDEDEGKDSG